MDDVRKPFQRLHGDRHVIVWRSPCSRVTFATIPTKRLSCTILCVFLRHRIYIPASFTKQDPYIHPSYLKTLTIFLSSPIRWLHLLSMPISLNPHFSITLPEAGLPMKRSVQICSKLFIWRQ